MSVHSDHQSSFVFLFFFFFKDTAPTEIYTLSLHDALPICRGLSGRSTDGSSPGEGSRCDSPTPSSGSQRNASATYARALAAVECSGRDPRTGADDASSLPRGIQMITRVP